MERYLQASRAAAKLLDDGVAVFSPIAYNHPMKDWGLPTDWKFWERIDKAFIDSFGYLLILTLDGWKQSDGVSDEIKHANEHGYPVLYISYEDIMAGKTEHLKTL